MTIETKYNIGDGVWVVAENEVQHLIIDGIRVDGCSIKVEDSVHPFFNRLTIYYYFDGVGYIPEHKCFHAKEELIKSL
jgi:hypothetical protein